MVKSSARSIAYDLRPAKQTQRRILLTLMECAREAGLPISDCAYIGMGGFRFYDFIMIYRFTGIRNLVSLEHSKSMAKRCKFNLPYDFIDLCIMSCSQYITKKYAKDPAIFWLDYDSRLSGGVVEDIQALGTRLAPGSFVFVTVDAELPIEQVNGKDPAALEELRREFGDFALGLELTDVEQKAYPKSMSGILRSVLTHAFSSRTDGVYFPLLSITYKDSSTMATVGGVFCDRETGRKILRLRSRALPFMKPNQAYHIRWLNLSDRERHLMEFAATKQRGSPQELELRKMGMEIADIRAYRDLIRFLPRYVETIS